MGPHKQDKSKNNDDYLSKRARNNEAVKRSREKARVKAKETHDRVNKLKAENEMLEEKIKLLSKELTFLKDIFLAHAGSTHSLSVEELDITELLKDASNEDEGAQPVAEGNEKVLQPAMNINN